MIVEVAEHVGQGEEGWPSNIERKQIMSRLLSRHRAGPPAGASCFVHDFTCLAACFGRQTRPPDFLHACPGRSFSSSGPI